MATTPVFLPKNIQTFWLNSLQYSCLKTAKKSDGLPSMGSQRVGHDRMTEYAHMHIHIYTHRHTYVSAYVYTWTCIYMYISVYLCEFKTVF